MKRGLGDLGVDIFFVISGFLVMKSLLGKESIGAFAWARITRIFPALWISTLLLVAVVGLFLSPLSASDFWIQRETLTYILKNSTMLPGVGAQMQLPNALLQSHSGFNIPLWTLPHELQMYALLAVLGAIGIARYGWVLVCVSLLGLMSLIGEHLGLDTLIISGTRARFLFLFFAGASLYSYRHRIAMHAGVFWLLLAAVVSVCLLTTNISARQLALMIAAPYLVLWLAYIPTGAIRRFNALGDYSYGIYILAFPLQLMIIDYLHVERPLTHFALSMCAVLPFAIASWHLIESRFLSLPPPQLLKRLIRLKPERDTVAALQAAEE